MFETLTIVWVLYRLNKIIQNRISGKYEKGEYYANIRIMK